MIELWLLYNVQHSAHLIVDRASNLIPTNDFILNNWRLAIKAFIENLNAKPLALVVFVLAFLLQLPLVLNVGYFSHDELQWASNASVQSWFDIPWSLWLDFEIYQYRPLTFNIWLALSYWSFDQPFVFHAICVVWGALNASLLMLISRQAGLNNWFASLGALVFVLNPYAVYVHGWVATMADMLVMSSVLLIILLTLKSKQHLLVALFSAMMTVIALLSKESAIAIPAILGVIWLFDQRKIRWLIAMLVAGLVTLCYLVLRFETLMQPDAEQYALSPWNPPLRWLEYHWYWFLFNSIEPHGLLVRVSDNRLIIACLIFVLFLCACWRSDKKLTWLMLLTGLATLIPVLPISKSSGQYGYLFSAVMVMATAALWPSANGWKKYVLVFVTLLSLLHGYKVMQEIRHVGQVQSVFSPTLAQVVSNSNSQQPIRFKPAADINPYIFVRLMHEIHSYQGVPIGDRVQLVEQDEAADFVILADGRIVGD